MPHNYETRELDFNSDDGFGRDVRYGDFDQDFDDED